MSETKIDTIKLKKNSAEGNVNIRTYFDSVDNVWYSEIPAFEIMSYGDDEEESQNMVMEALAIHIEYMMKKGSIYKELERLGWTKEVHSNRKFKSRSMDDLKSKLNPAFLEKSRYSTRRIIA